MKGSKPHRELCDMDWISKRTIDGRRSHAGKTLAYNLGNTSDSRGTYIQYSKTEMPANHLNTSPRPPILPQPFNMET